MTTEREPTRRDYVDATRELFRNSDWEERQGIRDETDTYHQLNGRVNDLERQLPRRTLSGAWDQALAEHEKEATGSSHHPWWDPAVKHDGTWWKPDQEAGR